MLDARCSRRDIHRFRARAFSFITKTPAAVLRKKKTLAEGLQIAVPTDSAGRRMWSRMSDEEVVEYARKVMRENKINTRGELQKADSGLHGILKRRGLLGKIKFEEKQKSWKGISGEKVVEFAKKIMGERGISSKMELKKADCGLYMVLRRRELLDEVGLEGKQKSWKEMGDTEIVEFARKVMRENKINTRGKLQKADGGLYTTLRRRELLDRIRFKEKRRSWESMSDEEVVWFAQKLIEERKIDKKGEVKEADRGLYSVLRKRGLFGEVGFEEKRRSWESMSDEEVVEYARKVMKENEISGRTELKETDSGLYKVLRDKGLLDEVGFEEKWRKEMPWKDMSDEEVVGYARKEMEKKKITGRNELQKADMRVYSILRERGLLDEIGFEEKRRKDRPWKDMSDEEIVEYAKRGIGDNGINSRYKLQKADSGLYGVLKRRGLFGRVFANIEKQRTDQARQDVIDALTKFANSEKPEVEIA